MTAEEFFQKALFVEYGTIAISFLVGAFRIKALNSEQRILLTLIFLVVITEVIGRILWQLKQNNLFIFHFYAVAEFLLLGILYRKRLIGLISRLYMNGILLAFVLFSVINTFFFQSLKQFNSHVTFVESLLLILFALLFFYKILQEPEQHNLKYDPMFWVNVSVLTYFSGAMVLFHVANDLIPESLKVRGIVWGVHALFNIVHYFFYGVALWTKPKYNSQYHA